MSMVPGPERNPIILGGASCPALEVHDIQLSKKGAEKDGFPWIKPGNQHVQNPWQGFTSEAAQGAVQAVEPRSPNGQQQQQRPLP